MEVAFALPVEILLTEIAVPALEQNGEEAQFIFFAQCGHRNGRSV
jgi:hypothetical protein